jgi:CRP/FNR family transcriptional regulator
MRKIAEEGDCAACQRRLELFKPLSEKEVEFLSAHKFEVRFNAGEIMFKQGGPLTHVACITRGMVKVYIENTQKKNLILSVLQHGEITESPGLGVDHRHHFSVAAIEDTTACFIEINALKTLLIQNTQFAMKFIGYLNQKQIIMHHKLVNLTHKQMPGLVADALLYLADEIYHSDVFNISLSRQDLAELSALTKESVIRILKEFKEDGIIDFSGNHFDIKSKFALQKISETG